MIELVNGNALQISLRDESVHCVVTSTPYWGLRSYSGIEPIEWSAITYAPMPGLDPVTVAGCDLECEHVWGAIQNIQRRGSQGNSSTLEGRKPVDGKDRAEIIQQGQFCQLCGGWRGHLGLEPTPEMYVAHLVAVFREVRRVMRSDAVCWMNLGDSFANDTKWGGNSGGKNYTSALGNYQGQRQKRNTGLKQKDLIGIPWRVAFALQADGWWIRSDVIWAKGLSFCDEYSGSVMPESVNGWRWSRCRVKVQAEGSRVQNYNQQRPDGQSSPFRDHSGYEMKNPAKYANCPGCPKCADTGGYVLRRGSWRPTKAHEYVFMLTKSDKYFCDREAVKENVTESSLARISQPTFAQQTGGPKDYGGSGSGINSNRSMRQVLENFAENPSGRNLRSVWSQADRDAFAGYCAQFGVDVNALLAGFLDGQQDVKDVFVINPGNFPGAHYAVFPPKLVEPCIKAATSEAGVCGACGAPWVRVVETPDMSNRPKRSQDSKMMSIDGEWAGANSAGQKYQEWRNNNPDITLGFRPSCTCCQICDIMGLQPNERERAHATQGPGKETRISQAIQDEAVSNRPRIQASGGGAQAQISKNLRPLRESVSGQAENIKVLQPDVFGEMDVGTGSRESLSSIRTWEIPISENKRQDRIHTSPRDGRTSWASSEPDRGSTPHQRGQIRQQDRKPNDCDSPRAHQDTRQQTHEIKPYPAIPATVLDPFVGSGTTALVARELGRNCIGLDLSGEYLRDQARPRLELDALTAWNDDDGRDGTGEPLDMLPLFAALARDGSG